MSQASVPSPDELLTSGWSHLADGRWSDARRAFVQALASQESPQGYEGLSWAAWWLDDRDTVLTARETAYRAFRASNNPSAAARMACWLAADHLDFDGASSVARGWLRRADRLLSDLEPGPDHGWLAFHGAYLTALEGDIGRALEQAREAVELGWRFDVPDQQMLGLALEGTLLVGCGRVEEGMQSLDEATATALEGQATVPISGAWACCFLVGACTTVYDFQRAGQWCDRIAEFAERYGSRYMLAFCRAEYGAIYVWRGRWPEAEKLLESSAENFRASRPAWAEGPIAGLAELRRRQGRWQEAEVLAGKSASPEAIICRARLALDRGQMRRADELAGRLEREMGSERRLDLLPVKELLLEATLARGDLEEAAGHLRDLQDAAGLAGTPPVLAIATRGEGRLAAAQGSHEPACLLLEEARDLFRHSGSLYEAARTGIELATSLADTGRNREAAVCAEQALDELEHIGAQAEAARAKGLLRALDAWGRAPGSAVTRREREVLVLLAEGLTNRGIAERLVVSEHTVHRHVTNILRKLGLPSRTAAAAYAVRTQADRPDF